VTGRAQAWDVVPAAESLLCWRLRSTQRKELAWRAVALRSAAAPGPVPRGEQLQRGGAARGLDSAATSPNPTGRTARAQGLYKQMVESFRGLGVEAVPGVGAPFDPELHEAIMREFRRGFRLAGKLLRAAMVQARGPRPAPALRPRRGRLVGGLQGPGATRARCTAPSQVRARGRLAGGWRRGGRAGPAEGLQPPPH